MKRGQTDHQAQRVVINGTMSSWKPVTTAGVSTAASTVSHLCQRPGCLDTLCKYADGTEMGRVVDTPDGCAAIQIDLDMLEKSANRSDMKFNR